MLHVDGRSMANMDSPSDRMRLKDKILANVAKAVKSIQELQVLAGERSVMLGNFDWQCHRLCEHIDHSLLHGLRHVTPGYWQIVSEFTHKDCIKQIKRMTNVTTDLGRGRAWLFLALNEGLLECYLQCYTNNTKLVEEYYVKDALVRDQDKFSVLLTLCSGLETIVFNLDCDVPYLDLCMYPPKSRHTANAEATVDFDRLSLCSMESVHLPVKPLPQTKLSRKITTVFESMNGEKVADTVSMSSEESGRRNSTSADSGIHSEVNYRQRSITPIEKDSHSHDVDGNSPSELEVFHVTKKGKSGKSKKKRKTASVSEIVDFAVGDTKNTSNGPVITIPPLDEIKLLTAIQVSQEDNHETSDIVSDMSDMASSWASQVRCPGDGLDSVLDQSNLSKSLVDGQSETSSSSQFGKQAEDNGAGSVVSKSYNNRDSGVFTEMIKARVSAMTTEKQTPDEGVINKDHIVDETNDERNANVREDELDGVQTFKSNRNVVELYNGVSVDEEEESKKTNAVPVLEENTDNSETSIYNSRVSYDSDDLGSEEDTEVQETLMSKKDDNELPVSDNLSSGYVRSQSNIESSTNPRARSAKIYQTKRCMSDLDYAAKTDQNHSLVSLNASSCSSTNQLSPMSSGSRHSVNSLPTSPLQAENVNRVHSVAGSSDSDVQGAEKILQAKVEELITQRKLHHYTHLTFGQEEDEEEMEDNMVTRARSSSLLAGEVELDNNSLLFLMLDIVEGDETFVKLFRCRQGHTEGKVSQVFVLLVTNTLYLLHQQPGTNRFIKQQEIAFKDIDFVSLGFDSQVVHIACKHRRQKSWLTTGDERISIAIVDCLADSMDKSDHSPGRLEVDTGNMAQKISLNKYIARESACEPSEVEVVSYSLVHWEDPQADLGSCEWDRQGNLYYKSNETTNILGTQTWRLAYAVLQDSMLCLYQDQGDDKPIHFLSLKEGQCVGCKRDFNSDRNHSVRVILADGTYWSLSLECETEANNWIQSLCQAVSAGLQMNPSQRTCIACSMVLSPKKVFMCHEDLETNFIRTLGSARLEDITSVLTDSSDMTFLILAFDSMDQSVSSEKWVLYFNSVHECHRFSHALSNCWAQHFQVDLPKASLENFALQKKCHEMSQHLNGSVTMF